ncbi:Stf0 family sulfotransferase [Caenimonas koreensis]|nr:Stf0 family sulfotransferase [Caenimonas koreensis]
MSSAVQATSNVGNIRKIDFLMSPERDFPRREAGASYRYVLCSTPRSGSNLIGDMLHATQLAGDPQEYLNTRYIAGFMRSLGDGTRQMPVEQYMAQLEKRRSSANGVFGIKIHYEHIAAQWPKRLGQAMRFLRQFDQFVLLTRRDKVAQAVSLHKARQSQIWSSLDYKFMPEDDPRRTAVVEYDARRIMRALSDLVDQEEAWRVALNHLAKPFVEIAYEDVVADYVGESHKLLRVLGIDPAQASVTAPNIRKQGADNDPMIARFKAMLGVAADHPA